MDSNINSFTKECIEVLDLNKANNIEMYDLSDLSQLADYYIICSASSTPHLKALANYLRKKLKDEYELIPSSADGEASSSWIVIDYIDFIVHIFAPESREFYNLEEIWKDGKKVFPVE